MSDLSRVNTVGAIKAPASVLASIIGSGAVASPADLGSSSRGRVAPRVVDRHAGEVAELTA